MARYLIGRLIGLAIVFVIVSTVAFVLMHSVPGGPFDEEKSPCRRLPRPISCASTASTSRCTSNTCATWPTRCAAISASRSKARPRP